MPSDKAIIILLSGAKMHPDAKSFHPGMMAEEDVANV